MYPFKQINQELVNLGEGLIKEWFPHAKKIGREWCVANINGSGNSSSLRINLDKGGVWRDFAKGEAQQGDLVELYRQKHGLDYATAGKELVKKYKLNVKEIKPEKRKVMVKILKPPSDEPPVFFQNYEEKYIYRDTDGKALYFFGRKNLLNGKKTFIEMCWSDKGWANTQYPAPRPLYNLHLLSQHPNKPVIFTEGEKAADACQSMVGDRFVVTTVNGGTGGMDTVYWQALKGRGLVIVWPDNDGPGAAYGVAVIARIHALVKKVQILDVGELTEKADAADLDWDYGKWKAWAEKRLSVPKDVRNENVKEAIKEHIQDVVTAKITQGSPQQQILWNKLGLQVQDGKIKNTDDNIRRILTNDETLRGAFFYDLLFNLVFSYVKWNPWKGELIRLKKPIEYDPTLATGIKYHIQDKIGINRFPAKAIEEGIDVFVKWTKEKNTLAEHWRKWKWDGKKRIDSLFSDYLGCPHDTIHYQMSANFFKMTAKRVLDPGCKSDVMCIFQGKQGQEKARFFKALAGTFMENPLYGGVSKRRLGDKEFDMCAVGKVLVEIGECEKIIKHQLEDLKDYLVKDYDYYRRPYDKLPKNWARHHTVVGTTNKQEHLCDSTGERRFWPIEVLVDVIDIDAILKIREQIWAEAIARLDAGEKWWIVDKKALHKIHLKKKISISIYDIIQEYCEGRERVNIAWLMQDCLGMEKKELIDYGKTERVKECLILLGYTKSGQKKVKRDPAYSNYVSCWEKDLA